MTQEELAGLAGALATRADEATATPDLNDEVPAFKPLDFRLNVGARLSEPAGATDVATPLPDLDSPLIRKLTWENVVSDDPSTQPPPRAVTPLLPPTAPDIAPLMFAPAQHRDIVLEPLTSAPVGGFELAALPPLAKLDLTAPAAAEPVAAVHDEVTVVEVTHVEPEAEQATNAVQADVADEPEVVELPAVVEVPEVPVEDEPDDDEPEIETEPEVDLIGEIDIAVESDADVNLSDEPIATVAPRRRPAQPEYNQLALVPDIDEDEDEAPIELPAIAQSGPVVVPPPVVVYMPVLNESAYVAPVLSPAVQRSVVIDNKAKRPGARPKRHLIRSFMTMVVVFGLLGAGAYTAKKYLLGQPTWAVEMKPLADDVALERGLQFKSAVEVTELPIAEYATRLAKATGLSAKDAPTWRALGLLNGEVDLEAIGRQALNDSPAFYEPASKTIFVVADLKSQPHLYRFAMRRALTAALLDQQFDWGGKVADASPSAALAIRATIDGDALAVANALAANDTPDQLAPELFAFVQAHGSAVAASQFAATIAGRVGVATRPTIASMVADHAGISALEQNLPGSDAVLNIARPASAASAGSMGLTFWYYVLAGRIDDTQAWLAVTHWTGDSLSISAGASNQCVEAKVSAADPEGAATLLAAFESWAAAAPAESTTTVVPIDGDRVAIRACDPGSTVAAHSESKIPVVFGGAAVERALVEAAVTAAGGAKVDAACLVTAARQRGTALSSPADDAPVLAVSWASAYVAANVDLTSGCATPAG